MTPDIIAIVSATVLVLHIAGLGFIAYQIREMNDGTFADDASIFLQRRQLGDRLQQN